MAITVSATNPTNVTVVSNTVTTSTVFNGGATNDQIYAIADDIAGTINHGVMVGGFGLQLQTTEPGGGVTMVNNGGVTVDQNGNNAALVLVGKGGAVTYGGTGFVTSYGSSALALFGVGTGDVSATIGGNMTANAAQAVQIVTGSGAVNFIQAVGTTISNRLGGGSDALTISTTSGNIVANLNGRIFGDVDAAEFDSTTGDINVNFTGSIGTGSADGIDIETAGAITINSSGDFFVRNNAFALTGAGAGPLTVNVTGGQIHAGVNGIVASASATSTGDILINMTDGQIGTATQRTGTNGILATGGAEAGDLTITSSSIFANANGINARMGATATGDLAVTANNTISGVNGSGIHVENDGTGTTTVIVNGAVSGFVGISDAGGATTVTNNGSIAGTSGAAIDLNDGDDVYDGVNGLVTGTISGGNGNDILRSGVGNNTLSGGEGNDLLDGGLGADAMFGGAGDDIFVVDSAGDTITENAGEGTDTVRSHINWTLRENIELLELLGSATNGAGNALNNTLVGNSLNNVLNGGAGNDYMRGGAGNDIYIVAAAGDITAEDPGQGTDTVRSYINWTLGANVERLELQGSGDLNGSGNSLNNTLVGNAGNNSLSGGDGNDYIVGGAGNDTLSGGAGNDTLIGGAGSDSLNGGAGNDRFDFDLVSHSPAGPALRDSIVGGFSHGFDLIDLATIDANTLVGGNQAFSFIGSAAFSGVAGQLRYTNYSGNVIIDADVNGDSLADMQILVAGTTFMAGADFIL
jgi:Ca2+-binding RTX toxin-like protein